MSVQIVCRSFSVFALPLTVAVVGCSSSGSGNPSAASAVQDFVNGYCSALESCLSTEDGGASLTMSACVTALTPSPLPSGTDACNQTQINQCLTDIKNAMCSTLSPTALMLPGSCMGC
jgi:hypothetical protein